MKTTMMAISMLLLAYNAFAWGENTNIEGVNGGYAQCYRIHDKMRGDGYRCDLWKYSNDISTPQTFTYPKAFDVPACAYENSVPSATTTQTTLALPHDMLAPFLGFVQVFACHPPALNQR
jgi:hypothetical protein